MSTINDKEENKLTETNDSGEVMTTTSNGTLHPPNVDYDPESLHHGSSNHILENALQRLKQINSTYLHWALPIIAIVVVMMFPQMGTKISSGVWVRGGTDQIIPGGQGGGPTVMDIHGVLAFLTLLLFPLQVVTGGSLKGSKWRIIHRIAGMAGIVIVPALLLTGMVYAGQYWTNTSLAIIVNGVFAILIFVGAVYAAVRNHFPNTTRKTEDDDGDKNGRHNDMREDDAPPPTSFDYTLHKDLMFATIVLICSFAGIFRWFNKMLRSLTTCPGYGISNLAFSLAIIFGGVICFVVWRELERLDRLHYGVLSLFVVGGFVQWAGSIGLYGLDAFHMTTNC